VERTGWQIKLLPDLNPEPSRKSMKRHLLFSALLLIPAYSKAEDAPDVPPPAPAAVPAAPVAPAPTAADTPPVRAGGFRHRMMEKFDADKDGKLSETERAAAKAAFKEKGGEFRAKVLERFDADKDGKLSETERAAAKEAMKEKGGELRAKVLEKFDADKDGKLSDTERAAAKAAWDARQAKKGAKGKASAGDKGEDKAKEQHARLLEKFDGDKDGQLSEAERAKAREARNKRTGI